MKRFKKKNNQINFEAENTNLNRSGRKKQALKFAILLAIIVAIFALGYYFQNKKNVSSFKEIPTNVTVSVIDAGGELPTVQSVESSQSSLEQPAQNPSEAATVEDLGGNNNNPTGIDTLLEGKEIEIKK